MNSNINQLSEHILTLNKAPEEYDPATVARLKDIAEWGKCYISSFLSEGMSLQYAAKRLTIELQNFHPDLEQETISDILMYAHFYIYR